MKKIVMIFAAMAAVLSSCQNSELESVSANDGKDIVLNISVSNPGADDTKALIKTGWAENDEISIWYDTNTGETPDLVITYNGTEWIKKVGATVSEYLPSTGDGRYAKAIYNGSVKVASKDGYTYENNTLTFNIKHWVFLTEVQVVVKNLTSVSAGSYTLACDKFTPLASTGNGYTVSTDGITASKGDKGTAVTGISNTDGVAFVFATADYSETDVAYKFTLTDNTISPVVTKEYTATTNKISGTSGSMSAIKALTIANGKFKAPANPLYVEIEADYDNNPNTPNTPLKWYRQNLAITESGNKAWKGSNSSAVEVPGTNENVIVGDYFQWAAYENYSPTRQLQDRGLLLYTSFDNKKCGDANDKFYTDSRTFSKSFNQSNAPHGGTSFSKYTSDDNKTELDASDDVANIILVGNWRMPTSAEFSAMRKVTYWAWDATDCGYYVFMPNEGTTGAANGNGDITSTDEKSKALLFFPAAGYGLNTILSSGVGSFSYGYYWSSSLYSGNTDSAYYLTLSRSLAYPQSYINRYYGYSVRPVSD